MICKITKIVQETPDVKSFWIALPKNAEFKHKPGQFVMLKLPQSEMQRAYSLCSTPEEVKKNKEIIVNLKHYEGGVFSTMMHNIKEGAEIDMTGPFGKFMFEDSMMPVVLISGGTGICPSYAILKHVLGKKLKGEIKLLYSSRTKEDIIFYEQLKKIAKNNSNFKYVNTLTRHKEGAWNELIGRITPEMLKTIVKDFSKPYFFLCGPPIFVNDIISMLKQLGISEERIKSEKY